MIDIENLSQTMLLTQDLVSNVKSEYLSAIKPGVGDIYIVGVSHFNLAAASFGWGSGVAHYVVRSGENGADLALIESLSTPGLIDQIDGVVIGSGDGIFLETGQMLTRKGVPTSYVGREECISRSIYLSGCECLTLPSITKSVEEYALVS